ncbi:hypothetical protein ACQPZ8_33010 [Actinomadura nitritigenes]|uniref:hypothetical protein n=1 Tax=Actinomadura nitritigenes TaxID=134602 RepID=UPI003D93E214
MWRQHAANWGHAMDRLESAVWPLAGGALCAFFLAVVLKDVDWRIDCAAAAVSVACWALRAPMAAAAALGVIGWLFVTGFDIAKNGDLTVGGASGLIALGALVGAGLAASLGGRWLGAFRRIAKPAVVRASAERPDDEQSRFPVQDLSFQPLDAPLPPSDRPAGENGEHHRPERKTRGVPPQRDRRADRTGDRQIHQDAHQR